MLLLAQAQSTSHTHNLPHHGLPGTQYRTCTSAWALPQDMVVGLPTIFHLTTQSALLRSTPAPTVRVRPLRSKDAGDYLHLQHLVMHRVHAPRALQHLLEEFRHPPVSLLQAVPHCRLTLTQLAHSGAPVSAVLCLCSIELLTGLPCKIVHDVVKDALHTGRSQQLLPQMPMQELTPPPDRELWLVPKLPPVRSHPISHPCILTCYSIDLKDGSIMLSPVPSVRLAPLRVAPMPSHSDHPWHPPDLRLCLRSEVRIVHHEVGYRVPQSFPKRPRLHPADHSLVIQPVVYPMFPPLISQHGHHRQHTHCLASCGAE